MRPGQSNKRSRGRGRKGPSPLSRSYESNGPDVKIRGTAQHIADKYINLARDAQSSGDTVLAEAYLQHAEHFYRIVAVAQQQMNQPVNVKRADDPIETEESENRSNELDPSDPDAPQPEAGAEGSNQGGDRRDEEGDGERRGRRNRNRQRRGRGDDMRGDNQRADGDRFEQQQPRDGAPVAENAMPAFLEAAPESTNGSAGDSEQAVANDGDDDRPRRAPRQRRSTVDVSDQFADGAPQDAAPDAGAPAADAAEAPESPKPISFGDDLPSVQAAPDETN